MYSVTKVVNDIYSSEWVLDNRSLDNSIMAAKSDKATVIMIKDANGNLVCMMKRKDKPKYGSEDDINVSVQYNR